MTTRIVLGWDGSTASRAALRWATGRVAGGVNRLVIVHAVPADDRAPALSAAAVSVTASITADAAVPGVDLDVEVHRGGPVAVLLGAVDADCILVVGHDVVPSARGSRPSIAARLVDAAPCTVVAVPADAPSGHGVVVGVDVRSGSAAALHFAGHEARRAGTALRAVTVWSRPGGRFDAGARREVLQTLEEHVEEALRDLPDLDIHRELVEGPVARRLADAADGAALLVVGAGTRRRRTGPVVEQVLRASRTAVAVVR
ncbi:universal stress protein [Curtobacterium sp. PhB115]|uniref:universal stress protein n=1 Tax=Curtobacterium sp. PhB115 TaxID=2485173 RepID=UPI00161D6710|nr:universal stress protein [Curtobacterium sp. PhB115]